MEVQPGVLRIERGCARRMQANWLNPVGKKMVAGIGGAVKMRCRIARETIALSVITESGRPGFRVGCRDRSRRIGQFPPWGESAGIEGSDELEIRKALATHRGRETGAKGADQSVRMASETQQRFTSPAGRPKGIQLHSAITRLAPGSAPLADPAFASRCNACGG